MSSRIPTPPPPQPELIITEYEETSTPTIATIATITHEPLIQDLKSRMKSLAFTFGQTLQTMANEIHESNCDEDAWSKIAESLSQFVSLDHDVRFRDVLRVIEKVCQ